MSERRLGNRKPRFPKGRRIAVSDFLFQKIDHRRRGRSWDAFLRDIFGLPDRSGNARILIEGMLETTKGLFIVKFPETTWEEAEEMARKLCRKGDPPIRMREVR